jgi:hypothetical protein
MMASSTTITSNATGNIQDMAPRPGLPAVEAEPPVEMLTS